MSDFEKVTFLLFFGGIILLSIHAALLIADKGYWKSQTQIPRRQKRILGCIFLIGSLAFLIGSLNSLAQGTFKWKGSQKTYSFQDFSSK